MEFWIKNPGTQALDISDLSNLTVEPGQERNLFEDGFSADEIEYSESLQALLTSGDLQRLDGSGGQVMPASTVVADNDSPIWNADRLMGLPLDSEAPAQGEALVWDGLEFIHGKQTISHAELVDPDAGDYHPRYHNDARALSWLSSRTTDDLPEGTDLYYTEARVSANSDVTANTQDRHQANSDTALALGTSDEVAASELRQRVDVISDYLGSGLLTGGGLAATTGVGFTVTAGTGIVDAQKVSWPTGNYSAQFTGRNQVYVDASGNVNMTSSDCGSSCIPIGTIYTNTEFTELEYVAYIPKVVYRFSDLVHDFIISTIGALVDSGLSVSANQLELYSAPGNIYIRARENTLPGVGVYATMYKNSLGEWAATGTTDIDTSQWNDSNGLASLSAGYWKKDLVLRDADGTMYIVLSKNQWPTKDEALSGELPEIPDSMTESTVFVAAVVTSQGATSIEKILDIRPLLSRVFGYGTEGAAGTVISHGSLTGLTSDDHPQYHTDSRALTWLQGRSTTDLPEGQGLYYTEQRVSANTDVQANTSHRQITSGNPHSVTAAEVGSALAQWNAGKISGLPVDLASMAVGEVIGLTASGLRPLDLATATGASAYDRYDASGDLTIPGSWTTVTLDTERRNDGAAFAYSSGIHTATMDGVFVISARVTTYISSGNSRTSSLCRLVKNGTEVPGSRSTMYNRTQGLGKNTGTFAMILALTEGDEISLEAMRESGGSTLKTMAGGSSLTMFQTRGEKGETGPAGSGSTVIVKSDGQTVINAQALDFREMAVADAGGGRATVACIFGSEHDDAESLSESSTTSSSPVQKLAMSPTLSGGRYRIGWAYNCKKSNIYQDFLANITIDGVEKASHNQEMKDSSGYIPSSGFVYASLSTGQHTLKINYWSEGGTSYIKDARLEIWRVS